MRLVLDNGVITTSTVTIPYRVTNTSQAGVMIGADYAFEEYLDTEWRPVSLPLRLGISRGGLPIGTRGDPRVDGACSTVRTEPWRVSDGEETRDPSAWNGNQFDATSQMGSHVLRVHGRGAVRPNRPQRNPSRQPTMLGV